MPDHQAVGLPMPFPVLVPTCGIVREERAIPACDNFHARIDLSRVCCVRLCVRVDMLIPVVTIVTQIKTIVPL